MVEPTHADIGLGEIKVPLAHRHPQEEQRIANETADRKSEDAILADRIAAVERLTGDLDRRVARLEIVPGPEPFTADYHIAPDGSDTADGLTRATAWRSVAKAPAGKVSALWDGPGAITGGAVYDRDVHLVTATGVHAVIGGYMAGAAKAKHTLRLQRAHGSTARPGAGGSITVGQPLDFGTVAAADGEKVESRRAALELTDSNDLGLDLRVVAKTDFGVLTAGSVLRGDIRLDVSDAGHGVMLKGILGTGSDRTWFSGHAHDCNRMVRNLRDWSAGGAYGAVGWVNEGADGGGLRDWASSRNFAACFQYGFDGGGIEGYNGTNFVVEPGVITDCEGGFETGGSSGKGIHGWTITGLRIVGAMTRNGKSPAVLIRNFEGSTLDFDADVTSARVLLEVYQDAGQFGGSIDNSVIRGTYVRRGIPATSLRDVPASTTVSMVPR